MSVIVTAGDLASVARIITVGIILARIALHAASENLGLVLNLYHFHSGLHIFLLWQAIKIDYFLMHICVVIILFYFRELSFLSLNHDLFAILDIHALLSCVLYLATLQVVDIRMIHSQLSIVN